MTDCSFIISAAGAHLLRTAIAVGTLDATLRNTAGVLFARLVVTLTSSHHAAHWDVASLALDRIASLLRSLDGQLPELAPLLQLFGAPNHAPATGVFSAAVPVAGRRSRCSGVDTLIRGAFLPSLQFCSGASARSHSPC